MSVPDPEEPDRRGEPTDTDRAFAEIVAGWQTEPDVPRWPDEDRSDVHVADPDAGDDPDADDEPAPRRAAEADADTDVDDPEDHFVPPDPPPLPVPRPRTLGGVAMIGLGIVLLAAPQLLGVGPTTGLPLGLLVLAGGIGWLVMGLRSGPPPDSGEDDGARL